MENKDQKELEEKDKNKVAKLKVKNERYSEITGKIIKNPYDVECEIVKENKSTCLVYVPKWKKQMTVKRDQLYN